MIRVKKKIVAKKPEFWRVGVVSSEKHCSEVFSLGCSSFLRNHVRKNRLCCDKPSQSFVIINQGRPLFKVEVLPRFIVTKDRLALIARTLIT